MLQLSIPLYYTLKNIKKYKLLTASFLLMIYAFIATPTQYWHSHNKGITKFFSKPTSKKINSKTTICINNAVGNEDCKICSHQYVNHINEAHALINSKQIFATAYKVFLPTKNYFKCPAFISDRAPPLV